MKAVLRHPTLLLDLCELMRPLWAAAEARDEPALDADSTEDATEEEVNELHANRLGLEVERAMLCVIGTKRRRTSALAREMSTRTRR